MFHFSSQPKFPYDPSRFPTCCRTRSTFQCAPSGKTDICVKEGDRAAFVAECAVWRGEKHLLGKADQLLGYLTWRDCKAALIIFNKEVAGFAELLNKVPEALARHRFLMKDFGQQGEGEWRYVFRSAENEGRRITVHVFLFDLFVK